MKKIILFIATLFLSITLFACNNKKKAVINLCCIDYNNIRDNYTGIDIIDEGCIFAKVEKWTIKCKMDEKVKVKVDVYDGYHIKTCYYNTEYTIENATTLKVNSDNTVDVTATNMINYLIFDIIPNEA